MSHRIVTMTVKSALDMFGPLTATDIQTKLRLRGMSVPLSDIREALRQLKSERVVRVSDYSADVFVSKSFAG